MKREEVKDLLQKYFEGETTLEEERMLADFCSRENLPDEMAPYRQWFESLAASTDAMNEEGTVEEIIDSILVPENKHVLRHRAFRLAFTGIAASMLMAVGTIFWVQQRTGYRDTYENPEHALAKAKETLQFVSLKYNQGLASLAPVHRLSEATRPMAESIKTLNKGLHRMKKNGIVNE